MPLVRAADVAKRRLTIASRRLGTKNPVEAIGGMIDRSFDLPLGDPRYGKNELTPGSFPLEHSFSEMMGNSLRLDMEPLGPQASPSARQQEAGREMRRLVQSTFGRPALAWFDSTLRAVAHELRARQREVRRVVRRRVRRLRRAGGEGLLRARPQPARRPAAQPAARVAHRHVDVAGPQAHLHVDRVRAKRGRAARLLLPPRRFALPPSRAAPQSARHRRAAPEPAPGGGARPRRPVHLAGGLGHPRAARHPARDGDEARRARRRGPRFRRSRCTAS